jgi:hypothetical protein
MFVEKCFCSCLRLGNGAALMESLNRQDFRLKSQARFRETLAICRKEGEGLRGVAC